MPFATVWAFSDCGGSFVRTGQMARSEVVRASPIDPWSGVAVLARLRDVAPEPPPRLRLRVRPGATGLCPDPPLRIPFTSTPILGPSAAGPLRADGGARRHRPVLFRAGRGGRDPSRRRADHGHHRARHLPRGDPLRVEERRDLAGGRQAEALRLQSCDRCIVKNADVLSLQDTSGAAASTRRTASSPGPHRRRRLSGEPRRLHRLHDGQLHRPAGWSGLATSQLRCDPSVALSGWKPQ